MHGGANGRTGREVSSAPALVRVGFLNSSSATTYRAAVDQFPGGGISRAAVAKYLHEEAVAGRHGCSVVGLVG